MESTVSLQIDLLMLRFASDNPSLSSYKALILFVVYTTVFKCGMSMKLDEFLIRTAIFRIGKLTAYF